MGRQDEIRKIANQISRLVNKLKSLDCHYSDQASDIVLFDDTLEHLLPEDRIIGGLSSGYY